MWLHRLLDRSSEIINNQLLCQTRFPYFSSKSIHTDIDAVITFIAALALAIMSLRLILTIPLPSDLTRHLKRSAFFKSFVDEISIQIRGYRTEQLQYLY